MADRLVQAGDADDIWKKEVEKKLKASRRYLKVDYISKQELKQTLDSHGGIVGCQIAVCKVNEQRKNAENIKLDGISYFHNFEFNYWEVCVWKAYSIGVGKVITISTMAERL